MSNLLAVIIVVAFGFVVYTFLKCISNDEDDDTFTPPGDSTNNQER